MTRKQGMSTLETRRWFATTDVANEQFGQLMTTAIPPMESCFSECSHLTAHKKYSFMNLPPSRTVTHWRRKRRMANIKDRTELSHYEPAADLWSTILYVSRTHQCMLICLCQPSRLRVCFYLCAIWESEATLHSNYCDPHPQQFGRNCLWQKASTKLTSELRGWGHIANVVASLCLTLFSFLDLGTPFLSQ